MVHTLPRELRSHILGFMDAGSIKNLHSTSKDLADITTGIVSRSEYHEQMRQGPRLAFHDYMGRRLWKLFKQLENTPRAVLGFDVDRMFGRLWCFMDACAEVERIPLSHGAAKDIYYNRAERYPPANTDEILSVLTRLSAAILDVRAETMLITHHHTVYKGFPGALSRSHKLVERAVRTLN